MLMPTAVPTDLSIRRDPTLAITASWIKVDIGFGLTGWSSRPTGFGNPMSGLRREYCTTVNLIQKARIQLSWETITSICNHQPRHQLKVRRVANLLGFER